MLRPTIVTVLLALAGALPAWAAESAKFVTAADGARIAYYPLIKSGSVPVIILSGGPGADSRYMRVRGALARLARMRTVVFFDPRGTGHSSDSDGTETIDQYVEDVEAIRKAIGAPKIDFIGHSFGGYIAMAYTAMYPSQVRGLVLVDSSLPKASDQTHLMDHMFPERVEAWRAKRASLGRNATGADVVLIQSMEFVDEVAMREFLGAVKALRYNVEVNNTLRKDMAKLDYWPQVRTFRQPALVVHGRFDAIIALSNGWLLHDALPNSTFRIIEGAGHLPLVEKPDAFLAVVQPFFDMLDRGGDG